MEKVQHAIVSMEGKMTAALERIEERLDRLEAAPISTEHTPFENVRSRLQVMITTNASRITFFFIN